MASNFDFLKPDFAQLFDHAIQAENLIYTAPRASCFYARYTLEQAVHWLYKNDPYLNFPDSTFFYVRLLRGMTEVSENSSRYNP